MPAVKGKSLLAAKLGEAGRKAVAAHADDNTDYGQVSVPEGIENGVAQLVKCYFSEYEKGDLAGEPYYRAVAVIVSPEAVDGVSCKGLQFNKMEPLCDTPKNERRPDVDAHVGFVLNEFRKLGGDTKGKGLDDLEDLAADLQEAQPYFRFRSWKGEATEQFPNPRVNVEWQGYLPDYSPEESDGVDDDTAEAPAVAPKASPAKPAASVSSSVKKPAAAAATPPKKPSPKPAAKPAPEPEPEEPEGEDWDSLAEVADGGGSDAEEAQAKLTAQAGLFNVDEDEVANAPNWVAVAELIKAAAESDEAAESGTESTAETDSDWEPAKEEIYFYLPPKAKKKIECEVTTVDKKTRTVGLKGLNDKKIYKGVSWDDLAGE